MSERTGSAAATGAGVSPRVPKRVAAVILNSLKGGVVPRIGLPYITVGRETEIRALPSRRCRSSRTAVQVSASWWDATAAARASCCRRSARTPWAKASSWPMPTSPPNGACRADQGPGLATYRELQFRNLSTKTRPEGGALGLILDRWVASTNQPMGTGVIGWRDSFETRFR